MQSFSVMISYQKSVTWEKLLCCIIQTTLLIRYKIIKLLVSLFVIKSKKEINNTIYTSLNRANINPLTPTVVAIWPYMGIEHPIPDRVKRSFVSFDIRTLWRSALSVKSVRMLKITNDGLTRSSTGCFIAVSILQQQWASRAKLCN